MVESTVQQELIIFLVINKLQNHPKSIKSLEEIKYCQEEGSLQVKTMWAPALTTYQCLELYRLIAEALF